MQLIALHPDAAYSTACVLIHEYEELETSTSSPDGWYRTILFFWTS